MNSQLSHTNKCKQENPLNLSVLKLPEKEAFLPMESRSPNEYVLYHELSKKINLALYEAQIPRSKLLSNLDIYQWRHKTQFPIVKTRYVHIKENDGKMKQILDLNVYVQYCPLRLNYIYQMNLGQSIYLLKESLIGFQRLFNRFGGFIVSDSMISVNEKGQCKVWFNQNFSLNTYIKTDIPEKAIVNKLVRLMQIHSNQSKASRNLFSTLKNCNSFLQALKQIDTLVKISKVLVPSRFTFMQTPKQTQKINIRKNNILKTQYIQKSLPLIRYSIKSTQPQQAASRMKIPQNFKKSLIKVQSSKQKFKRFKSQDKIIKPTNVMKISDGQTAYSNQYGGKSSNLNVNFSSPRQTTNKQRNSDVSQISVKKAKRKWIQESSFIMGGQQPLTPESKPNIIKQKKQLSHSQAFKSETNFLSRLGDRKFSAKIQNCLFPLSRKNNQISQSRNMDYDNFCDEFAQVLGNQSDYPKSPKIKKIQSIQEEDYKIRQHTDNILKNNGWKMATDVLMTSPKQLDSSFHSGQQQILSSLRTLQLQKLDTMGRREVMMSMLPEQYEDNN